jgi:hypothetical protein
MDVISSFDAALGQYIHILFRAGQRVEGCPRSFRMAM